MAKVNIVILDCCDERHIRPTLSALDKLSGFNCVYLVAPGASTLKLNQIRTAANKPLAKEVAQNIITQSTQQQNAASHRMHPRIAQDSQGENFKQQNLTQGPNVPLKILRGSQCFAVNSLIKKGGADFYAFLTAGSLPDPDWLRTAIDCFDSRTGAVACRIDQLPGASSTRRAAVNSDLLFSGTQSQAGYEHESCAPTAKPRHDTSHPQENPNCPTGRLSTTGASDDPVDCAGDSSSHTQYDFSYRGGEFEWLDTLLSGKLRPVAHVKEVFFASFAGAVIRRLAFVEAGGFDFEGPMADIDFFWRVNLLGWKVAYTELGRVTLTCQNFLDNEHELRLTSPVYSSIAGPSSAKRENALCAIYKNLDKENLHTGFMPALHILSQDCLPTTSAHRSVGAPSYDSHAATGECITTPNHHLHKRNNDAASAISPPTPAHQNHITNSLSQLQTPKFTSSIVTVEARRQEVQKTRAVTDRTLFRLIRISKAHKEIIRTFGSDIARRTRVLVITGDRIGKSMAGPAIRAWNISEVLSRFHEVRLVSTAPSDQIDAPFKIISIGNGTRAMSSLEKWADVIIFQGHALSQFQLLKKTKKFLIADVYDPMHLEQLEQAKDLPLEVWRGHFESAANSLDQQFLAADYFICASERQRHFYLGHLMSSGKVAVEHYQEDSHLRNLIDVVPFGLSSVPPRKTRECLRGVYQGIGKRDKILIWAGGLYNWFDPETLILAVADLAKRRKSVRLFFQGTKHPNPAVPEMSIVQKSRALARDCGVLDKHVFFNDTWVDYDDRQNYLLESDAGVTTHFDHVETTFSFRTRALDYLWAGLPMVITEGDVFASWTKEHGLGLVVEKENVAALSEALEKILFDREFILTCKKNIEEFRRHFFWEEVLAPLIRRLERPNVLKIDIRAKRERKRIDNMPWGSRRNLALVYYYYKGGGVKLVFRKIITRIKFLFGRG